jgi:hypothetical protein
VYFLTLRSLRRRRAVAFSLLRNSVIYRRIKRKFDLTPWPHHAAPDSRHCAIRYVLVPSIRCGIRRWPTARRRKLVSGRARTPPGGVLARAPNEKIAVLRPLLSSVAPIVLPTPSFTQPAP